MSSDTAGLCNLEFLPRYERLLADNLPPGFTQFAEFFSGTQRLHTLAAVLDRHLAGDGLEVLNVGSGPFATEIFVAALQGHRVTAIDYKAEFAPFHELFRAEGQLETTSFVQADIMARTFPSDAFDLIILHDILYENALDLEAVIGRLIPAIKPGGLIFFDFVNARTRWVWAALGKPDRFRRYDPDAVRRFLAERDLAIVEWRPTHGAKRRVVKATHQLLAAFGMPNNFAVLARRDGG